MKRISLWILSTVSVVVLLFSYHTSTAGTLNVASSLIGSLSTGSPTTNTATGGPPSGSSGSTKGSGAGSGSDSGSGKTSGPSKGTTGSGSGSGSGAGSAGGSGSKSISGTTDGNTIYTRYGPVQVQISVSKGQITNVTMLQEPQSNSYDLQIDRIVVPMLVRETINTQSANIQMISGATYTSTGYIQSLQSAIDKSGI